MSEVGHDLRRHTSLEDELLFKLLLPGLSHPLHSLLHAFNLGQLLSRHLGLTGLIDLGSKCALFLLRLKFKIVLSLNLLAGVRTSLGSGVEV